MFESTVTSKGQTTLPRDIRNALGLKPGDQVRYIVLDSGEVRILPTRPVSSLAGLLRRPGAEPVPLEAMEEAIAQGAEE